MIHSPLPSRLLLAIAAVVAAFTIGGSAMAQVPAGGLKLPAETAKLKPSRLPGYQLALQKCGICHSADYIAQQPPA
ncbi:MAG: cytochrome, partial [Polaromonas sp.]|nr:cytochrome [Polaromonas sp.]